MKSFPFSNPAVRRDHQSCGFASRPARGAGFTLIEILIVMSITALVAALTLGGLNSIGASNKRTTCQTNLSQIYAASRLYQADEGAFPYYQPQQPDTTDIIPVGSAARGIGLWALYAFPDYTKSNGLKNVDDAPLGRYVRSAKVLHCPQDGGPGHTNSIDTSGAVPVFNLDYASYQTLDVDAGNTFTYQSVRTTNLVHSPSDANDPWKRQLLPTNTSGRVARPPADNTIVAWCLWHRKMGGRNYDNVLFYDGSVQLIPRDQTEPSEASDWKRVPRKVL